MAGLLAGAFTGACTGDRSPVVVGPVSTAAPDGATSTSIAAPTSPSSSASVTATTAGGSSGAAPSWVVGATPLPLRPDGYGEILPTPPGLVRRSLPTTDLLPPPASGGFESTIGAVDDSVRARMGGTWVEGCPVALEDLRYLTVSFVGFDGAAHTGELVIHAEEAVGVVGVFEQLFVAGFPIEEMRLITDADLAAPPTGDGNNTAAFVCRTVRGGTRFSAHASGLAIDLDPFTNPYQNDDVVLPELASAYLDRGDLRPGMLFDGDVAVRAFEAIGWTWGGRWDDPVDLMHFSATGT